MTQTEHRPSELDEWAEIVPCEDDLPHEFDVFCECLPQATVSDGMLLIIHNAFDGREESEH